MKKYTMSFGQACEHKPEHPERTARKSGKGMNFDVTFQVWPSRQAMLKTLEMQGKRDYRAGDWKECKSNYIPGRMVKVCACVASFTGGDNECGICLDRKESERRVA